MATNIDKLSIEIEANTEKATQAVKTLTATLNGLSTALNRINTRSISSFATSIENLSTAGRRMDITRSAVEKVSKELVSTFGIRSREGVDNLTLSLLKVSDAAAQLSKATDTADINKFGDMFEDAQIEASGVIREYARIRGEIDNTAQSVKDYIKATNKGSTKISLSNVAPEIGEDFANMRKVLGKNFTAELKSTQQGVQDFEVYLNELNKTLKTSFNTENISQGFNQLVKTLKRAKDTTVSYKEAVSSGLEREEAAIQNVKYLTSGFVDFAKINDGEMKSGMDALVESFERLSKITLPDLQPFADTVKVISHANFKKLVENMLVIRSTLDTSQAPLEGIGDMLEEINEKFNEIANGTSDKVNEELDKVQNKLEETKNKTAEVGTSFAEILGGIGTKALALSAVFEHVSQKLNKLGNGLMKVFNFVAIKPLKGLKKFAEYLGEDFKEHVSGFTKIFTNFRKKVEENLNKMSATWRRVMRTFTFMLVRKAITAIIGNIKEASDELALFEKHLGQLSGGRYNNSLSEIIADFKYIARAIVAAFEPLVNFALPAINAISNALANVLAKIGEFFAAFTGQKYFVKAKKTVVDYGDSIDKNNDKLKEQQKLLLGIDELNLLNKKNEDSGSDSGAAASYKDAYEEIPISSDMLNLVKKLKEILEKLFDPLKKAWDNCKEYLMKGFTHMKTELLKLFKSIARDFLTVWQQPETQKIFENLLLIVGDLMFTVGNLAMKFREAWDAMTDDGITRGQSIFEGIRDIIGIIVQHVRNVTEYMKEWSAKIDFNPLLKSLDEVLKKLKPVADFLGGVFEDVMQNIVLEHIRYLTEEGIPHLLNTIGEVADAFNWEDLRKKLQPVEIAFEKLRQNIHEGLVTAMGNLGKELGRWTQTEQFQKFCDAIVYVMGQVTAERVEKLFTGLGMGILKIVEGLAAFVGSDDFKEFIDTIVAWYDSISAEDISNFLLGIANGIGKIAEDVAKFVNSDLFKAFVEILLKLFTDSDPEVMGSKLEKLAFAIAAFKFTAFVGTGLANFFKVIGTLKTFTTIGKVAKGLTDVATATTAAGGAAAGAGTAAAGTATATTTAAASLGGVAVTAAAATADLVAVGADFYNLYQAEEGYSKAAQTHKDEVKNALDQLYTIYNKKGPEIAAEWAKTAYNIDISGQSLFEAQNSLEKEIDSLWDDTPENMFEGFEQGWDHYFGKDGAGILKLGEDAFTEFISGVKGILGIASPSTVFDEIGKNTTEGFQQGFNNAWSATDMLSNVTQFVTDVIGAFSNIGTDVTTALSGFKTAVDDGISKGVSEAVRIVETFGSDVSREIKAMVKNAENKFIDFKDAAGKKFGEARDAIGKKLGDALDVIDDKLGKMKDRFIKLDLTKMGENVIKGFLGGLRGAWASVQSWAAQAVADIKAKFAEALQINSPSRVFMKFGEFTVEGYNIGLEKYSDTTGKVIDKWVEDFSDMEVTLAPDIATPNVVPASMSYNVGGTDLKDVIQSAVSQIVASNRELASMSKGDTKIILEMDGRVVYEQMVRQDRQQVLRTGRSSFAY